jgi:two-component system sensor histidine kinase/response regulator
MNQQPHDSAAGPSGGATGENSLETIADLQRHLAERDRTIASLHASERFLNSLLEHLPIIVYRKDTEGRLTFANRLYCERRGQSLAALLGKTDFDLSSRELAEKYWADNLAVMQTRRPIEKDELQIKPGGERKWIHIIKVPIIDGDDRVIGTQGMYWDITEAKLAEEQIRKLSTAVEQSPVSIVITDLAGNIEYANPTFSAVTGYSFAEAKGRNPRILKSGETPAEAYQQLWRTLVAGDTWRGEFHNRRKNGELYWEEATISSVRDSTGCATHYLAVKEDITARKRAEQELRSAKIAAEAAARAKSEFLANMSHEIRTPMNGVIGMTGLLLDTKLNPEQRELAESVSKSADNLMAVINDILDFSKIEAGKLTFEVLDFDLVETIEGTLDMLAERAQGKGVELLDGIAPNVSTRLRGDPGRLRQVLTNLIGNALKFTEHGEVVVRVQQDSETATHAVIRFNIVDTGIGIPPDVQGRLFQSFSQADNSTTRKYGGTGLGLAISKQLVSLMNGQIGVQSEAGKGSTFWFTVELEKQTGDAKPVKRPTSDLFNLRVLVVDDNATNRQILRHQIFAWKMQKGSAAGGFEALKILRAAAAAGEPYDLALLDMQMPEMDGMTLARAIKADPSIAPTRLVMLTSLGHRFSAEELNAVGLDAYLIKPVKQSRLFDTLVDVMGRDKPDSAFAEVSDGPVALAQEAPPFPRLHLLVAEDNQVNQKIAVAQLKKLGCTVDVVANGLEVLEALPRVPYDLVFMDCQMPEIDGYEATQLIRKREQDPRHLCRWKAPVHIVAMTANAMQGDREKCLAAGMDDYVSKPMRLTDLRAALERCLKVIRPPTAQGS